MIYLVTTINGYPEDEIIEHLKKTGKYNNDLPGFMQEGFRRSRTWGYYMSKKKAVDSLLTNINDMWEVGSFTYAFGLIEKFSEGIMCLDTVEEGWFFAKSNSYELNGAKHYTFDAQQIEKPKWSNGLLNWGMG